MPAVLYKQISRRGMEETAKAISNAVKLQKKEGLDKIQAAEKNGFSDENRQRNFYDCTDCRIGRPGG